MLNLQANESKRSSAPLNPLRKLAGQTLIYGISSIVGRLINFLLVPFYTRIFSQEQYGIVTEMYGYVAFLIAILTYGMETAYFRFSNKHERPGEVYSTVLFSIISTASLFILMAVLFSVPIGNILGYPNHTEYVRWFAIIVGLDAVSSIPMARLRQLGKARAFVIINLVTICINIGLNLFFLVYCRQHYSADNKFLSWCYNPEIGVGYVFISNLVASIVKVVLVSPGFLKAQLKYDWPLMKKMLRYALPLLILGLAGIINETLDRVWLKHLLPLPEKEALEQVGIYGACYKVAIVLSLVIQAFRYAAEPFFFSNTNKENARPLFARILNYFVIGACIVSLGILLFEDIALQLIGEQFRVGKDVIPVLLAAYLCFGLVFNLSFWYKLSDKTIYGAGLSIFGALITVLMNLILVPKIGYMGSAWATFICYASMAVASYMIGRRHYPIPYKIPQILLYIALGCVVFVLSQTIVPTTKWIHYSFNAMLLLLYITTAYFIERRNKNTISSQCL